ncbi:S1C family serine protease [Yinghuangia soli]|uniref:S1C family serine protease n=1 Tax=Yinghuangia soli TaxID=2908204 RepID=UPI0025464227|nr:trypsin-like peptidase domain-containing protein [Yinghuangia soli]
MDTTPKTPGQEPFPPRPEGVPDVAGPTPAQAHSAAPAPLPAAGAGAAPAPAPVPGQDAASHAPSLGTPPTGNPFTGYLSAPDGSAATAVLPAVAPMPSAASDGPARAPRKRRALAVVVAAALAAGLVGGAAGGWIGTEAGGSSKPDAYVSGAAPVTSVADKNLTGISAVAAAVLPSVVEIGVRTRSGEGTGSGIVLSADGKILTNAHVVDGATDGTITITFNDGRTAKATVLGSDSASDLAVLKVDGVDNLKPATLGDSDSVAVGDPVVAIGSPEGLTGTVTSGIVSALNREVTVPDEQQDPRGLPFGTSGTSGSSGSGSDSAAQGTKYKAIQTDASINPGNSGGPLVDMNGRVIGINSAIYSPTSGALGTDAGSVGLGFAIPINQVKALLSNLESGTAA